MEIAPEGHYLIGLPAIAAEVWSHPISREPAIVGRAADCTIRLGDRSVSRQHAMIWIDGQQIRMQDLESANGTRVNEQRADDRILQVGDEIRLGEYVTLQIRAADQDRPLGSRRATHRGRFSAQTIADIVQRYREQQAAHFNVPSDRAGFGTLYSLALPLLNACDEARTWECLGEWLMDWLAGDRVLVLVQDGADWRVAVRKARPGNTDPLEYNEGLVQQCLAAAGPVLLPPDAGSQLDAGSTTRVLLAMRVPATQPVAVVYAEWSHQQFPWRSEYHGWMEIACRLLGEALADRRALASPRPRLQRETNDTLIGGDSLRNVRHSITRAATSDLTVLIIGETGTGKELVAREIHASSSRSKGPFIACNCAAIAESLLESELFGHEMGAFSGATQQHRGFFEQADGGTLLLDEIGETSTELQAKLLRVLQDRAVRRVGGEQTSNFDVRLIAATNRDLLQMVEDGDFRPDLYYRLDELLIELPPLRERPEDIRLLAEHFLQQYAERPLTLSEAAIVRLQSQRWPGNVRELESVIKRAVLLAEGTTIEAGQLQIRQPSGPAGDSPFTPVSAADLEREHILRVLESVSGNKSRAAEILGIDRSTLRRKLKKWQA